jgi:hypothetical protein
MSSELVAASTTDDSLIRSLETSLQANGIQVRDGAVQNLLDQREWIYPSKRIEDLRKKLNQEQLYSVFNYQHHLQSAKLLFDFIKNQDSCVVYGHKAQGKTQFLFFVFKLLQAAGEKVLFLDSTMIPPEEGDNKIAIGKGTFCGKWWKDSFLQIDDEVKKCLEKFYANKRPKSFGKFIRALRTFIDKGEKKTRVWIIIDEVVLFENVKYLICLPKEQDLGPFNWIITGSAGIGSWVAEKHLENLVFDLPLFTKKECMTFATRLCNNLNIVLEDELGVPPAGMDDWLDEKFGGVVGYIAELVLAISKGNSVSQYFTALSSRMKKVMRKSAKENSISINQLAEDWLNEIKAEDNDWGCLRDVGLCGSSSPRGVIFALVLKSLYTFFRKEDVLGLVTRFRLKFAADPGLDGCLLELEEILKLKASLPMAASLLKLRNQGWIVDKSISLPTTNFLNSMLYDDNLFILESLKTSPTSPWYFIQLPSGFDVIDVVLADRTTGSPAIYGIQITRSSKPFKKHHTFDTCPPKSREKLNKLWRVISNHFKLDEKTVKKVYVMLAPNCEKREFRPPAGHSSDFYFSPPSLITYTEPVKARKGRTSIPKDDTSNPEQRQKKKAKTC